MAGGDDLESDDEYLNQDWHDDESVEVAVDDSTTPEETESKKRSASDLEEEEDIVTSKKKKKQKTPKNLLLETGRNVADSSPDVQASFLWTAFTHALKLKGEEITAEKFLPKHFAQPKEKIDTSKYEKSMTKYLKSGVLSSMKRMKKWKVEKSPMVIIVSSSALRSVAILKDISSLNIRVAKLFAKHMNVSDQVSMLENNKYAVAVGTPNRLLKLIQTDRDEDGDGALSLESTELIIIDCFEDKKKFTVCTMNDTAPDMMEFINQSVVPQMKKRNNIKFGFF